MKRHAGMKLMAIALAAGLIAFAGHAWRLRVFGRVMAAEEVRMGGVPHRVLVRERCISRLYQFILLDLICRDRLSEYEYWAELTRDGKRVSTSETFYQDSAAYDHPRIDSADASGATVSLDPRPYHPTVQRFPWLTPP